MCYNYPNSNTLSTQLIQTIFIYKNILTNFFNENLLYKKYINSLLCDEACMPEIFFS